MQREKVEEFLGKFHKEELYDFCSLKVKVKGKGKGHPITGHESPDVG
jgi:hypothetical protein